MKKYPLDEVSLAASCDISVVVVVTIPEAGSKNPPISGSLVTAV